MLGTGVEWKKYRLSFGFWVTMTTNSMCPIPILSWNTKPFLPFAVAYAWRVSHVFLYMLQMCVIGHGWNTLNWKQQQQQ